MKKESTKLRRPLETSWVWKDGQGLVSDVESKESTIIVAWKRWFKLGRKASDTVVPLLRAQGPGGTGRRQGERKGADTGQVKQDANYTLERSPWEAEDPIINKLLCNSSLSFGSYSWPLPLLQFSCTQNSFYASRIEKNKECQKVSLEVLLSSCITHSRSHMEF